MARLKVLCLSSIKGGVGKTVASVNIGGCIAKMNPDCDVILVDTDPQGNTSMYLGYNAKNIEHGTLDIFESSASISECLCRTDIENMFIVPCEISLRNVQMQIALGEMKFNDPNNILKEKVEELKNEIVRDTYLIIDTHPDFDLFTINALMCADRLLCPINPCEFAVHGFDFLINNTGFIRERFNKKLRILGLFKNNWSKSNTKIVQEIEEHLGYYSQFLMDTTISSSVDIEKSKSESKPLVYSTCRNKDLSKNYMKLAEEIINKWERIVR